MNGQILGERLDRACQHALAAHKAYMRAEGSEDLLLEEVERAENELSEAIDGAGTGGPPLLRLVVRMQRTTGLKIETVQKHLLVRRLYDAVWQWIEGVLPAEIETQILAEGIPGVGV